MMTVGGPVYEIMVAGKLCAFEMHYLGPMPCTPKRHDPIDRDPGRRFWDAVERWQRGGSIVADGRCVVPNWCALCGGSGFETYKEAYNRRTYGKPCSRCKGEAIETVPNSKAN